MPPDRHAFCEPGAQWQPPGVCAGHYVLETHPQQLLKLLAVDKALAAPLVQPAEVGALDAVPCVDGPRAANAGLRAPGIALTTLLVVGGVGDCVRVAGQVDMGAGPAKKGRAKGCDGQPSGPLRLPHPRACVSRP